MIQDMRSASNQRALFDDLTRGVQDLAGVTRAELFRPSGTMDSVFARISLASSAYYLLGVADDADDENSRDRRIELAVVRPHVEVRMRSDLEVPRTKGASEVGPATTLEAMVRDGVEHRAFPIQVTAYAARSRADVNRPMAVVIAQSPDPRSPIASAAFGLVDAKERLVAFWMPDANELARTPVATATTVPPGDYRLRVAARDLAGRVGTAEFEFSARLTRAGDYDMSDLLVGIQRTDHFIPVFAYRDETTMLGYLEIYGTGKDTPEPRARFEIAATAEAPAIVSAATKGHATKDPGRWIATASLPIDALAPGDYIVRVLILEGNRLAGRAFRTFRKSHK
jgi:hypothetical protein